MMNPCTLVCTFAAIALMATMPIRTSAQEAAPATPAAEAPPPAKPAEATPPPAPPAVRVVDSANSSEAVVSMVFDETPIADVIKAFRSATGANIISGGTNLQGTVSVRLDNVPWRKGLSSILDQQGLQLLEQPAGSGIYVINTKTVEIPKITRTFELNYAKADDVSKLFIATLGKNGTATPFPSANVVIITAPEQQVAECETILKAIDKPRPQVYIEARFVEMSAGASKKLGVKWTALGGEGLGVNFDGAKLGYTDDKGAHSTHADGSTGNSSSSSTATGSDTFENDTRNILSDLTTETLLGSGATHSYDSSKTHDRTRTFTGSLSVDPFSLALNAFEQIDGLSVFSNPKIIVANEETALVDMTTKEPNVNVKATRSGTSSDQLDVTAELAIIPGKAEPFVGEAFYSYGISLKVTPRISASGLITVMIEPSISQKETAEGDNGYYVIGGASGPTAKYPIISMRRIKTVFTMDSGRTAVIGGLSRTTEGSVDSGIPFLRELPWIGPRLFGWKSREKGQKEIVIFVTVGIVDPATIRTDAGMPKNAILSREIMDGKAKEPGDRTKEDLMSIKDPESPKALHDAAAAAPEAEADTPVATEAVAAEGAPAPSSK